MARKAAATITFDGIEELHAALSDLGDVEIPKAMRTAVSQIAAKARDKIKARVPVKSGALKKELRVVRRRSPNKFSPIADVMFTRDGYYWRFVEHGTQGGTAQVARPFVAPSIEEMRQEQPEIYHAALTKAINLRMRALARKKANG